MRKADEYQVAAFRQLYALGGTYDRGPWIPSGEIVAAIQLALRDLHPECSHQAAAGSLRSLRAVGLADHCVTSEGPFWKASDALVRAAEIAALHFGPMVREVGK